MHLIFSRWYKIFKAFTEGDQLASYGQLKHRKPEEFTIVYKESGGEKKKNWQRDWNLKGKTQEFSKKERAGNHRGRQKKAGYP